MNEQLSVLQEVENLELNDPKDDFASVKEAPVKNQSQFVQPKLAFNTNVPPFQPVQGTSQEPRVEKWMIRQSLARDLPEFSGSASDWPIFINTFEHTTNVCGFSNHENLIRLQKCLKGQARALVEGLLILPNSVPEIISTLQTYCGNPARLIKAQIDKARNCPPMK